MWGLILTQKDLQWLKLFCCFIPSVFLPFPRKLRWRWRNAVIWFCCPVSVGLMKMKSVVLEAQRSHTHWTLIWWCHGVQCVVKNKNIKTYAKLELRYFCWGEFDCYYVCKSNCIYIYSIYLLFYIVAPWLIQQLVGHPLNFQRGKTYTSIHWFWILLLIFRRFQQPGADREAHVLS